MLDCFDELEGACLQSLYKLLNILVLLTPKKNVLTVHQGLYLSLLSLEFVPCLFDVDIPLNVY